MELLEKASVQELGIFYLKQGALSAPSAYGEYSDSNYYDVSYYDADYYDGGYYNLIP